MLEGSFLTTLLHKADAGYHGNHTAPLQVPVAAVPVNTAAQNVTQLWLIRSGVCQEMYIYAG